MKSLGYSFFLQKRYYIMIFSMFGWVMLILLRVNLSICLVSMRSKNTTQINTKENEDVIHWTPFEEGIILSSFSWGYILSPIGGVLGSKFGGVRIFGLGVLVTAIITIMSPFLMKQNYLIYLGGRFVEGVSQGISAASMGEIFFNWILPGEKTILTNVVFMGYPIGTVLCYPFVGYLTNTFNWQGTFYITGGVAVVWTLFWILMVTETPIDDKFIGKTERDKFKELDTHKSREKIIHPWKEMFTSKPLWALLNEMFIMGWSSSFIDNCIPLYIQDIHATNIEEIGWLSSLPSYFEILGKIPALFVAEYLVRNRQFSKTKIHKLFILSAQIGTILAFGLTAATNNFTISICAFAFFKFVYALAFISYNVIPMDLGGCQCGIVYGICTSAESLGNILNPIVLGLLVTNHTFAEWSKYFIILVLLNGWAIIIFSRYGSGELQPWAVQKNKANQDSNERTA